MPGSGDHYGKNGILGGMVMTERLEKQIARRDFLGISALGAALAAMGLAVVGALRLPRPTLLPEPSRKYKVGDPTAYPLGETRTPEGKNIYVFHTAAGFYAISSVCTHLGCIVKKTDTGFDCPCHGSTFDLEGKTISGPAPRPLEWFAVSIAPDGQLEVDEDHRVGSGTYLIV